MFCNESSLHFYTNFKPCCLPKGTVIIEKSHGGRFFMEQELRFGLDLGRLEVLGRLWATFEAGFFKVLWPKKKRIKNENIVPSLQVNFCQKLFFLQNMGRTCCVQKKFLTSETISIHNMFSPGLSLEFSCIELVIQWTICRHIVG